ncbi:NAD(P)/FAD-dependent oxidoreductase [Chloroflexota bacterium]
MKTDRVKYLIIGNSAGGIGAVEAIREVDKAGTITIISAEPYPAYSRPLISEYLAEGCSLERMLFRPEDFYQVNNINTILGQEVSELNIDKQSVKISNGTIIVWDKLLLATGGLPIIPPIDGIDLEGVFSFTTLDDAKAIDQFLNRRSGKINAVVIGGGLIGVSVTEALVKRGVKVSIIEMKDRLLNVILDEELSVREEEALNRVGVKIITGHTIEKVSSYLPGEVNDVILDDGRQIQCEMVIAAIGVHPRLTLTADTEIKINRGVVVDRHMTTSCPDVFACGDTAEAYDFIYDENRLAPIWPNAYIGGRIAGFNMAGVTNMYPGGTVMNAIKYFGENIVSAGITVPPDDSYEVLCRKNGRDYRKVILKDGLIVGFAFGSNIELSGIIYNLMKDKVNVMAFKDSLVSDDFGLALLPEEIWRDKITVPISVLALEESLAE